jgi:hypothetical protein
MFFAAIVAAFYISRNRQSRRAGFRRRSVEQTDGNDFAINESFRKHRDAGSLRIDDGARRSASTAKKAGIGPRARRTPAREPHFCVVLGGA